MWNIHMSNIGFLEFSIIFMVFLRIKPFVWVWVIITFCIHFVYAKCNYHCVFGHNFSIWYYKLCSVFVYQIFSLIVGKQFFELLPVFRLKFFKGKKKNVFILYKLCKLLINYRILLRNLFVLLFLGSVCCFWRLFTFLCTGY